MNSKLRYAVTLAGMTCVTPLLAASFIEDSKVRLDIRNFYYNADFRDGTGVSKREEWAQGFLLNYESGFTQGDIGVGLDALGYLGVRLDSSADRTGSGLLPTTASGEAVEEYSKGGLAAKVKVSRTELRYGIALPKVPVLQFNGSRLFPQSFQGTQISSSEIDGLTVNMAQFNRTTSPDSTDQQHIMLAAKNGRYSTAGVGNHFRYAGASYKPDPTLTFSYYHGGLEDVYAQHFLGATQRRKLGRGWLELDLRAFFSHEAGNAKAGRVDNEAYSALVSYTLDNGHSMLATYQHMEGDTGFPYINNPYLPNYVQYHDFAEAGERSWQLRYGYDFSHLGVHGLSFYTSYTQGTHLDKRGGGGEWERDVDVTYEIPHFKGLSIRWRNALYRSDINRGIDENRLILNYSLAFK